MGVGLSSYQVVPVNAICNRDWTQGSMSRRDGRGVGLSKSTSLIGCRVIKISDIAAIARNRSSAEGFRDTHDLSDDESGLSGRLGGRAVFALNSKFLSPYIG